MFEQASINIDINNDTNKVTVIKTYLHLPGAEFDGVAMDMTYMFSLHKVRGISMRIAPGDTTGKCRIHLNGIVEGWKKEKVSVVGGEQKWESSLEGWMSVDAFNKLEGWDKPAEK